MGKTPDRITATNVKKMVGDVATKQRSKEEAELPYVCEICGKRFKSPQGLSGHMITHNIETVDMPVAVDMSDEDSTAWVRMYAKGNVLGNEDVIKLLSIQERVTFIIPEDPYDTRTSFVYGLNGQMFEFPIGQYIVLPRDVVNDIKRQYKESELAKKRDRLDRSKSVSEALTR